MMTSRTVDRRGSRIGALAGLSMVTIAVALGAGGFAHADWRPHDVGDVVLVDPLDYSRELDGGASAVAFALRLPDGASCPGDSANDNWRIRSFLVPTEFDMADIVWGHNDPEGENQWSLYGVDSNPVIADLLASNAAAGEPGLIQQIKPLTFGVFTDGILAPGEYRLGVACMYFTETAMYWDATVRIEHAPDDRPAQLRWTVVPPVAPAHTTGGTGGTVTALAAVAVALAAVAVFRVTRARRPRTSTKERAST